MSHQLIFIQGVEFDTIAREWRFKWSADDEKKSLASAQQTLFLFKSAIKQIDGLKGVQRIVCGGCLDYKVIISLSADKYKAWVRLSHDCYIVLWKNNILFIFRRKKDSPPSPILSPLSKLFLASPSWKPRRIPSCLLTCNPLNNF